VKIEEILGIALVVVAMGFVVIAITISVIGWII